MEADGDTLVPQFQRSEVVMVSALRICVAVAVLLGMVAGAGDCDGVKNAGDVLRVAIPASAVTMTLAKSDGQGGLQFSKGFLTTVGITYLLKYAVDRERPNGGPRSFPSGHAAVAFSGASFIERRYGLGYGVPAYLAASFVGWSRVHAEEHYVEDVLAGAAIGIVTSYFFTTAYGSRLAVMPVVTGDCCYAGVSLRW
jgi:membrane-associated phospholipid phosphatase